LVFGNEVNGVDQSVIDASDYIIEIPQFGTKHSLNVSVCAGIVMWEFVKREIHTNWKFKMENDQLDRYSWLLNSTF